ncbi:MAG TPA: hypothetical protein VHD87_13110 [Acidimicrobiales bacterium]|nr:hypothetical protein [Acidimicrobiales bacterium]
MRVILALLATLTVVTIAAGAPRADAHFCSIPATIKVGQDTMVNIGVAAEEIPVEAVDIQIPAGFALKEAVGYLGYTGTVKGNYAHFVGGEIAPYTCHYFGFSGHATKRGRLVAQIITTDKNGTKTRYFDTRAISQFPAEVIYAGVDPADYAPKLPTSSGGVSIWVALAVAVGAGVLVVGGAVLVNRRRA